MIGHDEAGHDLTLDDVAVHDFHHIGLGLHLIPHALRIDYDARSLSTMIEASGFIGTYNVFQVPPLRFLLEERMERLRSKLGAASTGIIRAPLIRTDENVAFVTRHADRDLDWNGDCVESFQHTFDVAARK